MIDKDKLLLEQQKKIARIERLQKDLHGISMMGLFVGEISGKIEDDVTILAGLDTMHKISHIIEDVLDGLSPKKAIAKHMADKDEDDDV